MRALVARAALAALLLSGAWLAFASASGDWIVDTSDAAEPHWLRGPLAGVLPSLGDASFTALLVVMVIAYAAAVWCSSALPARAAVLVAFALVALFALAPLILSSDLFGYVAYAQLDVVHGLNPYLHAPSAAPHDPILPFVFWRDARSPYGPLYTLLSLPVGRFSLPAAVWSLKAVSAAGALVALALLVRAARVYGRPAGQVALLVGGNPLLVVWGVGGGHNDLVVMAAVAAALLAMHRRGASGGTLLAVATGLKVTGALLLPFALAASGSTVRRRSFAFGALAGGAVIAALTALVFGSHVFGQLGRIATKGGFVVDYSGPDALGRLLGTGVTSAVRLVCGVAAAATVLGLLWAVARRGADWLGAAALAGIAVLLAIPSLVPWYIAWVLPAAALAGDGAGRAGLGRAGLGRAGLGRAGLGRADLGRADLGRAARVAVVALTAAMVLTRLPSLGFAAY